MASRVRNISSAGSSERAEQLSLLPASDLPVQFRLDERTRRRGLEQIALIKQQLAARAAQRDTAAQRPVPTRRRAA